MPLMKLLPIMISKCCGKKRELCYGEEEEVCSHCLERANFRKATKPEIKELNNIEYCEWLVNNKI